MYLIRSFAQSLRMLRSLHWQLLFVAISFTLMIVSSGFISNRVIVNYLRRDAENVLTQTQIRITDRLRELEILMIFITKDVRDIIMNGGTPGELQKYFNEISSEIKSRHGHFDLDGIHGFFDIFDNMYIPAQGWVIPDGYLPSERPWYKAAVQADGDIASSSVFRSINTGVYQISFSCRIFDDEGSPLGIVAMNVPINNISNYISNMHLSNGGYGILLDERLEIIVHPDFNLISRSIGEISPELGRLSNIIRNRSSASEIAFTNYLNKKVFLFYQQMENGWYLGIISPRWDYFWDFSRLIFLMSVLGIALMTAMFLILIRIDRSRTRAEIAFHEQSMQLAVMAKSREADEQMQILLDSMPLVANFWNLDIQNINTNEEAVKMFNLKDKQEYLDRFHDLSPEYQPDGKLSSVKSTELVNKAFVDGYCQFEWMHQNLNGEPMPAEITLVRSKLRDEYVVAGYTRDLRERYRAIGAEESNRYKNAFIANMSHEIRTPMNTILGIAEIQLQENSPKTDAEEAFGKIYEAGNLLLGIVNDILDLTKIDAGKLEINPVNYDITNLINDIVQISLFRFENKKITFSLHLEADTPRRLFGDMLRIKQVLNNILSNAFKYTEKGEVTLSASAEYRDDESVTLIFSVKDTGIGMTEKQLAQLYIEYLRFNSVISRSRVGAGLGMSITKRLLDLMNGEISAESKQGQGSIFTVRLPQKRVGTDVCGAELASELEDFHFHNVSIVERTHFEREYMPYGSVLIVDDVESNIFVVKGLLSLYALQIETASSGIEAVEKIKNGRVYDIIFMDHMMPEMDGIEAVRIIRDMGYSNCIVALTANAVAGQDGVYEANGFDGFISKPIDSRDLNNTLNIFIKNKKPPEVVEEARRRRLEQKETENESQDTPEQNLQKNSELEKLFVLDAENFLFIMKKINSGLQSHNENELKTYVIAVHGIKSALANIGESELSGFAYKLEKAGKDKNFEIIESDTPILLNALHILINKFSPELTDDNAGNVSVEDLNSLQKKLLEIREACSSFDKKGIKMILDEIKQKAWPHRISSIIDNISILLLHSSFKKIVTAVDTSDVILNGNIT